MQENTAHSLVREGDQRSFSVDFRELSYQTGLFLGQKAAEREGLCGLRALSSRAISSLPYPLIDLSLYPCQTRLWDESRRPSSTRSWIFGEYFNELVWPNMTKL